MEMFTVARGMGGKLAYPSIVLLLKQGVCSIQMRRSTVVGGDGKSVLDNIRTSYGTFLR
jgi:hypothetical protein